MIRRKATFPGKKTDSTADFEEGNILKTGAKSASEPNESRLPILGRVDAAPVSFVDAGPASPVRWSHRRLRGESKRGESVVQRRDCEFRFTDRILSQNACGVLTICHARA